MRFLIVCLSVAALSGCIQIYGPVKPGSAENPVNPASSTAMASDAGQSSTFVGNRKPDEIYASTLAFFAQRGFKPIVQDATAGIIVAEGDDPSLASTLLDCSALKQTQNIQQHYRLVAQIWSAGEGTHISVQVNGVAGLTAADGNDKVKPEECKSRGVLEKDLLEILRK